MKFTYALKDINDAALKLWEHGSNKKVWAVHGEMGAGKTTLIHALCENLQVTSTVGSPTYSIINEYKTADGETIYHIDLYRLKDEEEALQAGVEDCLNSGSLCFIEWSERAPGLLPGDCFHIYLEVVNGEIRTVAVG